MIVPADLLFVALAAATIVGYRRRVDPLFLVALPIPVVLLALDIATVFPRLIVKIGVLDVVLAVLVGLVIADLRGLPLPLAQRLRIGRRSLEWEFDHKLHLFKETADRPLLAYPTDPSEADYESWRTRAVPSIRRAIQGMARLRSPTPEWGSVRDGYVRLYTEIADRLERDEPPDNESTMRRGTKLKEDAGALRLEYRSGSAANRSAPG